MKPGMAVALKEIETLLWEPDLNLLRRGLLGGRNYFESDTEECSASLMQAYLSIL